MTTTATFKAIGRLDTLTASAVEKSLMALLTDNVHTVAVDMSELDYISSAGLRVLLVVAKAAKAKGGKLVVQSLKPTVLEVIKISGFDRIITVQA